MVNGGRIPSVNFAKDDLHRIKPLLAEHGCVLIDDVYTRQETQDMKDAMSRLIDEWDPESREKAVFLTQGKGRKAFDEYLIGSVDKAHFFFEKGAVDDGGKLLVDKHRSLNKVGNGLHWANATFKKYTFDERVKKIMKGVGFTTPQVVQSMYIFKQPNIGDAVQVHVDSTFLNTDPVDALVGVWIALDDATLENGCLWFIPGSHKGRVVDYRFVRTNASDSDEGLLKYVGEDLKYNDADFVPVEVKRGKDTTTDGFS
ncbi:Phytanoyl-CoA dioxygenase [Aphelenchoides avenae]|nr:Phytanoyl-CoA dioxygenase [Aphelenchus avenae]